MLVEHHHDEENKKEIAAHQNTRFSLTSQLNKLKAELESLKESDGRLRISKLDMV